MKDLRKRASAGGRANAGGGSSVKDVSEKVTWMKRWKTTHNNYWPSCNTAKKLKAISYNLLK